MLLHDAQSLTKQQCLGFPSVILYTFAALYGLGNHIEIAMYAPKLTTALLFEWIAANTISYSCFFGKLSALTYILEVQDRTNKIGKSILIGLLVVNVSVRWEASVQLVGR